MSSFSTIPPHYPNRSSFSTTSGPYPVPTGPRSFTTHPFTPQVLVFYRHQETMQAVPWLWSGSSLPNPWPNTTSVAAMFSFLEAQLLERNPDAFFVTQLVVLCVWVGEGGKGRKRRGWWERVGE